MSAASTNTVTIPSPSRRPISDIVTPNNDTPYSWAWLDLRAEPIVLTVPTVPKDRYYVCQWFDLFTYNFAYVGVRATGFEGASYMFAGPNWKGETPKGIKQVFRAETDLVGTLTRTALNGPEDVAKVRAIQAGLKLRPLSAFLGQPAPPPAPAITFPVPDKAKEASSDFIAYLNFLLQFALPPHPVEGDLARTLRPDRHCAGRAVGSVEGRSGGAWRRSARALSRASANCRTGPTPPWTPTACSAPAIPTRPNYLNRAVAARKGIYGNSLEEAWYGGYCRRRHQAVDHPLRQGQSSTGKFLLVDDALHPPRPPALRQYRSTATSIGDRTKGLKYGADGSLTLTVSHDPPANADAKANWLPAPDAKYSLVTRIYGPKPELMGGTWKLPPLQPAGSSR